MPCQSEVAKQAKLSDRRLPRKRLKSFSSRMVGNPKVGRVAKLSCWKTADSSIDPLSSMNTLFSSSEALPSRVARHTSTAH